MLQEEKPKLNFDDLYDKPKNNEAKEILAMHKSLQAIGDRARSCLASELFSDYAAQFKKDYDSILVNMISYTNSFKGEPNEYAFQMMRLVQEAKDLRRLLGMVYINSNKGILPEEKGDSNV